MRRMRDLLAIWAVILTGSVAAASETIPLSGREPQMIKGLIKGYDAQVYTIVARAGQQLDVRLATPNRFLFFNSAP